MIGKMNKTINSFKDEYQEVSTDDRFQSSVEHTSAPIFELKNYHPLLNRNDINERVRRIRNKYGVGMSQLTQNDKQNISSSINLQTPITSQKQSKVVQRKMIKERRISELEQINNKISLIISEMKVEDNQSDQNGENTFMIKSKYVGQNHNSSSMMIEDISRISHEEDLAPQKQGKCLKDKRVNSLATLQDQISQEIKKKKCNGRKNRSCIKDRVQTENICGQYTCLGLKINQKRDKRQMRSCSNRRNCGSITKFTPISNNKSNYAKNSGRDRSNSIHKNHLSNFQKNYQNHSSEKRRKIGQITKTVSHWEHKCQNIQTPTQQQQKFVSKLCQQIKFDQQLMGAKNMVKRLPEKNRREVKRFLLQLKKDITNDKVYDLMIVENEEIDPEFTQRKHYLISQMKNCLLGKNSKPSQIMRECKNLAKILIAAQQKCETHWSQNLHQKFDIGLLKMNYLDMEGKGFVLKEDLARFISMFSKKLYSNRQIAPLFKKICQFGRSRTTVLKYQNFVRCFCA